ncbi:MAG: chemotaxis protein CheA [Bacillota bacterium]|nr:chemotaxis protein CheA [Bacillota bacterium]
MDLSQYMDLFLAEAKEHLESLNENLLKLEENPADHEVLNEIFRSAHTLKGMAATMGFEQITELTHEMENALTLLKEGKLYVTPEVIDVLLRCLDALDVMMKDLRNSGEQPFPYQPLLGKLQDLSKLSWSKSDLPSHAEQLPPKPLEFNEYEISVLKAAENSKYRVYHIKIGLSPDTIMKSVRAFMVFRSLEEYGQIIKCQPPVQDLEEEQFEDSFEVVFVSQAPPETISQALEKIAEVRVLALQELNTKKLENQQIGSHQDKIESPGNRAPSFSSGAGRTLRTVRVDIERLDNLMNLVGELVINKTRLEQIGLTHRITDLLEAIEQMGRLTTDLQSLVMKVRMVPIEQVFNRFPRMVRDLAREMGKDVQFIMEGKETELDRTVIDEIGDPLVHLIRNAIDHGIESPEERVQAGKEKTAYLRLAAYHEGNNVIIEVEDDGRGIDIEKVRTQAINKGFFTEKEREYLDDNALLKVIFQPGFSTADVVTDISGRGVGLDVVKSKIESLNGSIEVETKKKMGTKVKISLPLTLAIIQALLVSVGHEQYAIPLSSIDETTFVLPEQIKTVQNQEVMVLRGIVLPLVRLQRVLEVSMTTSENEELYVVVVRKGEHRIGLVVDLLVGQQDIVIKSLGKLLTGIPGIAGATILGNGEVSLILDVNTLF